MMRGLIKHKNLFIFLFPHWGLGVGWGGEKIYDSCKDCYRFKIEELGMTYRLWVCSLPTVAFLGRVLIEVPLAPLQKILFRCKCQRYYSYIFDRSTRAFFV